MPDDSEELLKGTLDMLILKALDLQPMHGWGIGERIAQLSRDVFHVQTGTLYPPCSGCCAADGSPRSGAPPTRGAARGTTG
jgi:hypothetical protein